MLVVALLLFSMAQPVAASKAGKAGKGAKSAKYTHDPVAGYEMKGVFDVADVREDFRKEFQGFAEPLLCSACKLAAAQFAKELTALHKDVTSKQKDSATQAMVQAWKKTCGQLPKPLVAVPGERGPEFRAFEEVEKEDKELAEKARSANFERNAERSLQMAGRVCYAVLYEFRTPLFQELDKAYEEEAIKGRRWERFLCGRHSKLCKLQHLDDDVDEEDDGGDQVDSVVKRREAEEKERAAMDKIDKMVLSGQSASINPADLQSYLDKMLNMEL